MKIRKNNFVSNITARWPVRYASLDQSADKIFALLALLAQISPLLTDWINPGQSRERESYRDARITTAESIATHLQKGQNRTDTDGRILTELGYSLTLWNGRENVAESAKLRVTIGVTALRMHNVITLTLPPQDAAPNVYTEKALNTLVGGIIQIFEPEELIWSDRHIRQSQMSPDRLSEDGTLILGSLEGREVGWVTYLRNVNHLHNVKLPAIAQCRRLGNGSIIVLGTGPTAPTLNDISDLRKALDFG